MTAADYPCRRLISGELPGTMGALQCKGTMRYETICTHEGELWQVWRCDKCDRIGCEAAEGFAVGGVRRFRVSRDP